MELKQNVDCCVILLHEIYGINQHMNYYAELLYRNGFDVYVPDLLDRTEPYTYEEEEAAYKNFIADIGFLSAKEQVNALIEKILHQYRHIRIIGFSIGATVGWLCSENPAIHQVIGFYGSRIRQYPNVTPYGQVRLIYGDKEKSFSPQDLKRDFLMKPNVDVQIVNGSHGFADPYSTNYHAEITNRLMDYLIK